MITNAVLAGDWAESLRCMYHKRSNFFHLTVTQQAGESVDVINSDGNVNKQRPTSVSGYGYINNRRNRLFSVPPIGGSHLESNVLQLVEILFFYHDLLQNVPTNCQGYFISNPCSEPHGTLTNYLRNFRPTPARPIRPVPNRSIVPGSGTGAA